MQMGAPTPVPGCASRNIPIICAVAGIVQDNGRGSEPVSFSRSPTYISVSHCAVPQQAK
jgi:hypothetical protein